MKTILILALAICIGFCSCKKDNSASPKPTSAPVLSLVGTWQLVSDSTKSSWFITTDHPTGEYSSVYIGTPSDHFTFGPSGVFEVSQNNALNNGTYKLTDSVLQLTFSANNSMSTYQVSQLTDHKAVLIFSVASPGGPSTNIITLEK